MLIDYLSAICFLDDTELSLPYASVSLFLNGNKDALFDKSQLEKLVAHIQFWSSSNSSNNIERDVTRSELYFCLSFKSPSAC